MHYIKLILQSIHFARTRRATTVIRLPAPARPVQNCSFESVGQFIKKTFNLVTVIFFRNKILRAKFNQGQKAGTEINLDISYQKAMHVREPINIGGIQIKLESDLTGNKLRLGAPGQARPPPPPPKYGRV
ncbi:hypothetical protein EVAR_23023_1 [Eumeta japonica]|uniref:Uncharacterized protein n=1 Tax=Eumeta variegata TaxID=151549 RepID=A0A4C1UQ40_EUMVA|nr:hypothetical protein EVAR_23023_1 [Eumeta japonica]